MALSNWLTRNEWNGCFFIGKAEVYKGTEEIEGLGDMLRIGIKHLHLVGYEFQGITADEEGNYEKIRQVCDGNEAVLAEIMTGEFNEYERAKETVEWMKQKNVPYDFTFLKEIIEAVEKG